MAAVFGMAVLSANAELVAHYEFDEIAGGASAAVNAGTSTLVALNDNWGGMNGSGQLIVSADADRQNSSLGGDAFGGNIYYRIDFNSWDTLDADLTTKFGFRLKSVGAVNKLLDVNLRNGNEGNSAHINTYASGAYDYVQGGMANPQTNGVSFILGVDTVSDTFSIWWDNGLGGTYTELRSGVALNLGGEVDFTQVNALTFDPGGGEFEIERIALGTDFYEIRALGNSGPPQLPDHLNVLLIVCDDLNDFEGVFGGHPQAQTPNIDALAASGVRFVNAHTNAPICGPSRSSFITGIYPHRSGIYGFGNWYNPGKPGFSVNTVLQNSKTLMHYMRDNGYQSYGTGKLMHFDLADNYVYPAGHPEAGNSQEFWDEYGAKANYGPVAFDPNALNTDGGLGEAVNHPSIPTTFYEGAGGLNSLFGSLANVPTVNGYTGWWKSGWLLAGAYNYIDDNNRDDMQDEEVRKWAIDKINELAVIDPTGQNEKFFMSVGFHNPHTPFVAPQAYFDLYPIETLELPPRIENDVDDTYFNQTQGPNTSTLKVYSSLVDSVGEASADGTLYATEEDFLKAYLQAYLACVSFVDAQIGALVEALDGSPYANNTVVILTSDHGYEWGEKEALSKNTLWDNSTRVPLVIRVPGFDANDGKQVTVPVALVDLYPTVRDLCGLDADTKKTSQGADLDGHSMLPLLIDPDAGEWDGPPVALSMVSGNSTSEAGSKNYAVRSQDWRYIRYENGMEELYCLQSDPYEFTNLIGSPNPFAQAKHAELAAELLTMVPELGGDTRNLLADPGFEWLTDGSSPDAGDTPWETEEGSGNVWQITREGSLSGLSGKYALKFQQRWTASPVKQLLAYPLDSSVSYDVSFWMLRDSVEDLGGTNDAIIDIELWSYSDGDGDYVHRGDIITSAWNSEADVWQQFHGTFDASMLAAYDGELLQLRIVRNDNVKQIIYLDDFVLDAYTLNTFEHWAFENGLNPRVSALDLDGDGQTTLEEYAFGGDPDDSGSMGYAAQVSIVGDSVEVTYPELRTSELIYELEYSTDLEFWAEGGFIQQTPVEQYGLDYWKAMSVMDTSAEKLFVRVKAETPVVEADPSLSSAIYVPTGYAYVWGDRFGGNELDATKWFVGMRDPDTGDLVPGANGDYLLNDKYSGYVTEEDSYVEDGLLILQNQKRSYTGTSPSGNYQYTSGWVSSMHRGHLNKGYIEVRAKFPAGDKVWPAILLVSEDLVWGPEWDLWEYFGYREDVGYDNMGMHLMTGYEQEGNLWPNQDAELRDDNWLETFDTEYDAEAWHIFGWEWTDTYARWWVDGKVVHTLYKSDTKKPSAWPDEEMYIILNNGVRSASPDATTTWPNQLVIDYIEVYQKP